MRAILREEVNTQFPQILPQAVSDFATPVMEKNVIESLEAAVLARSSSQPKSTYEAAETLSEFELTKILMDKIEKNKSFDKADYKRELYDALVKSYQTDKDLFDTYGEVFMLKRSRDDKDKDQDPSDGSDRGTKRKKSSKEAKSSRDSSQFARAKEPRTSFDELMDTTFDFSAFGTLHWGPKRQHFYGFAANMSSSKDVYSRKRIIAVTRLTIIKKYDYGHLEEIEVRRDDQKLYKFREGDFPRLRLQYIKDMLLILIQQKLTNLTIDERYDLNVALPMFTRQIVIQSRVEDLQLGVKSYQKKVNLIKPDTFRLNLRDKTTYTAYLDPKGVIYKDQNNRNNLMCADELYKFSDGTLNDVRTVLHDIAKGIMMEYLPKRK
ncbi:hypothetical protein Tco_0480821 [Tanacetum coccineum]